MKPFSPLNLSLGSLLVAGLATVIVQRQTLSSARIENQTLRAESKGIERLANKQIAGEQLPQENEEIVKLRAENQELYGLRNQVRQLRAQVGDLEKLRAENQRLRSVGAAAMGTPTASTVTTVSIAGDQLVNAGFATPEATLQSLFWGMREGDAQTLRGCFTADVLEHVTFDEEKLRKEKSEMANHFKSLEIVARKVVSDDETLLGLRMTIDGESQPVEVSIPFRRVGNEWKLNKGL